MRGGWGWGKGRGLLLFYLFSPAEKFSRDRHLFGGKRDDDIARSFRTFPQRFIINFDVLLTSRNGPPQPTFSTEPWDFKRFRGGFCGLSTPNLNTEPSGFYRSTADARTTEAKGKTSRETAEMIGFIGKSSHFRTPSVFLAGGERPGKKKLFPYPARRK